MNNTRFVRSFRSDRPSDSFQPVASHPPIRSNRFLFSLFPPLPLPPTVRYFFAKGLCRADKDEIESFVLMRKETEGGKQSRAGGEGRGGGEYCTHVFFLLLFSPSVFRAEEKVVDGWKCERAEEGVWIEKGGCFIE